MIKCCICISEDEHESELNADAITASLDMVENVTKARRWPKASALGEVPMRRKQPGGGNRIHGDSVWAPENVGSG
jgi:hypothetical protein